MCRTVSRRRRKENKINLFMFVIRQCTVLNVRPHADRVNIAVIVNEHWSQTRRCRLTDRYENDLILIRNLRRNRQNRLRVRIAFVVKRFRIAFVFLKNYRFYCCLVFAIDKHVFVFLWDFHIYFTIVFGVFIEPNWCRKNYWTFQ